MATDVTGQLAGIGKGLLMNVLYFVALIVLVFVLWYSTRWIMKKVQKQKAYTTTAIIVDLNGVFDFDKLAFVKEERSGLLEMEFQIRKTDSIPPVPKHLIKNGYVILLNYAPGHYAVVDTSKTVRNLIIGKGIIVPYNLGMKKYIKAKQREIMIRYDLKMKWWQDKWPYLILAGAVILTAVTAWAYFYFGIKLETANLEARMLECTSGVGR